MLLYCARETYKVIVINDQIVDVANKSTGLPLNKELARAFKTIPQLFDFVDSINPDSVAFFEVEYDWRFGFPSLIKLDHSAGTADDELTFNVGPIERLID